MRRDMIVLRLLVSTPACERSFSSRVTSPCKARAFCAVRRTSFVSASAAFSLPRHLSSCVFREPARHRASSSDRRSSSQRASAASARVRSRSCRERKSRDWHAGGGASGGGQASATPSADAKPAPISSSRTDMRPTVAHGLTRYQQNQPSPLRSPGRRTVTRTMSSSCRWLGPRLRQA